MNDDELGRLLSGALDAQAGAALPESTPVPAPRFATGRAPFGPSEAAFTRRDQAAGEIATTSGSRPRPRRSARVLAPLLAAAAVVGIVATTVTVMNSASDDARPAAAPVPSSTAAVSTARDVHIRLQQSDGVRVGVGMPVIAYFSRAITDARALARATTVTVDGHRVEAGWYFERSAARPAYPVEGHLRPRAYWPAHAAVRVRIDARRLDAGAGLRFDNNLSLGFSTGAASVATVNESTHRMTIVRDGKPVGVYPVSLGTAKTPTLSGVKVIMEKKSTPICLKGPGYDQCGVRFAQRLTYDGEFLHAAPWNVSNIRNGHDTSNGCTNLLPADAQHAFAQLEVGDIVAYPNSGGPTMALGNGYGDWNVPWSVWRTGGLARTH